MVQAVTKARPPRRETERRLAALEAETALLRERLAALESKRASAAAEPDRGPGTIVVVGRWIEEHGEPYRGQWVALKDGVLMGAGDSLVALKEDLKTRDLGLDGMFVTKVPY